MSLLEKEPVRRVEKFLRDFDYDKTTFSKHLWMYEGVVEYFAQHFQVNIFL